MSTRTEITCQCGYRILWKDVLQKGRFLRLFSPSLMYVKYRCSRCKRLGERFVAQDEWSEDTLRDVPGEVSPAEREHYAALGPIGIDEVIDFHFHLHDRPLSDLWNEDDV